MNPKMFLLGIDNLNLPPRVKNILKNAGIVNIGQLHKFSIVQLLRLRGIGRIAARQIVTAMKLLVETEARLGSEDRHKQTLLAKKKCKG